MIDDVTRYRYRIPKYTKAHAKWNETVTAFSWLVCLLTMSNANIHWSFHLIYLFFVGVVFPSLYFTIKFLFFQNDCINRKELIKGGWKEHFIMKFTDRSVMTYGDYSKEVVLDSNFWSATASFIAAICFFVTFADKISFSFFH